MPHPPAAPDPTRATVGPSAAEVAGPAAPRAPALATSDEPPPVLGSWRRLYLLVLGTLAAVIGLLALLSGAYR